MVCLILYVNERAYSQVVSMMQNVFSKLKQLTRKNAEMVTIRKRNWWTAASMTITDCTSCNVLSNLIVVYFLVHIVTFFSAKCKGGQSGLFTALETRASSRAAESLSKASSSATATTREASTSTARTRSASSPRMARSSETMARTRSEGVPVIQWHKNSVLSSRASARHRSSFVCKRLGPIAK